MLATPLEFPQKYHFCVNIHQFRVFYLEPSAPELKIATNIMEICFKLIKIEHFQNHQELSKMFTTPLSAIY